MSWLSLPLPNPFKSLEFSDSDEEKNEPNRSDNDAVSSAGGGVKEDLSAIGETIGRQLRGVAAFLAPPPSTTSPPPSETDEAVEDSPSKALAGIRSDLAEIGGSFKSSFSLISANKAVSGISKFASNLLQLDEEEDADGGGGDGDGGGEGSGGINDEIVQFVNEISQRPECWTDFPLELDDDFCMSDVQAEHASIIEQLVPSLASLRAKLGSDISSQRFWMIYFILLLPRLNEDDLEALSTPEIIGARSTLLEMLLNKRNTEVLSNAEKPQLDDSQYDIQVSDPETKTSQPEYPENSGVSRDVENHEHHSTQVTSNTLQLSETQVNVAPKKFTSKENTVTAENANPGTGNGEPDNMLKERDSNNAGTAMDSQRLFKTEDEISFSDLEEDENDDPSNTQSGTKPTQFAGASSPDRSNDWVRLNKSPESSRGHWNPRDKDSEGEDSNDWLTIDDFDP